MTRKGPVKRRAPAAVPFGPPPPGSAVVAHLRDPREKLWGFLLAVDAAGAWIRGIEISSFEDWARQEAQGGEAGLGLSTLFIPFLRVEKLVVDEGAAGVGSMSDQFHRITGVRVHRHAGVGGGE